MVTKTHCCATMDTYIDPKCEQHSNPRDCPDALVSYDPRFDSYALLPRFGESWVTQISFCPWCGDKKRDLRDLYFDRMDELGFVEPLFSEVPEAFKTDKWWKEEEL